MKWWFELSPSYWGASSNSSVNAFWVAFSSSAISELGDRSFITATALALKHNGWVVFLATFLALSVQSVFSVAVGSSIKALFLNSPLLRRAAEVAVAILYLAFATQNAYAVYKHKAAAYRDADLAHLLLQQQEEDETRMESARLRRDSAGALSQFSTAANEGSDGYLAHDSFRVPASDPALVRDDNALAVWNAPHGQSQGGIGGREQEFRRPVLLSPLIEDSSELGQGPLTGPATALPPTTSSRHEHRFSLASSELAVITSSQLVSKLSWDPDGERASAQKWGKHLAVGFKAFTLIYLAEFGDTSMVVTAGLASRGHPESVIFGACLANAIVNGFGVYCGTTALRSLDKNSLNAVAAILFGFFGLSFIYVAITDDFGT